MTQIKNHTSESNNQSICNLQAEWNVELYFEKQEQTPTSLRFGGWKACFRGNTFTEALRDLHNELCCENTEEYEMAHTIDHNHLWLMGDYTLGNETMRFELLVDSLDAFETMMNYYYKGRVSMEDVMAFICSKWDEPEDDELPISAFTAGTKVPAELHAQRKAA